MLKIKSLVLLSALSVMGFAVSAYAADEAKPADAQPAAAKLNDAQIAHIAYTAGDIDIKAAEIAEKKATNPEVKAFADTMIRDHKAVNDQALALVKKLGVTPEDNDTSKALVKQAEDERAKLSSLEGAAFDKEYANNEVAYHETVNGALEKTLIPSATNAELKSFLETGLKLFQGHEEHAKKVVADLK